MKVLGFLLLSVFIRSCSPARGLYYIEEKDRRTYADPMPSDSSRYLSNQILEILDIDDHKNSDYERKKSDVASAFMHDLYAKMESNSNQGSQRNNRVWLEADKIVSILPIESKQSSRALQLEFSSNDLPDSRQFDLAAAQLRVHLHVSEPVNIILRGNSSSSFLVTPDDSFAVFNFSSVFDRWLSQKEPLSVVLDIDSDAKMEYDAFIVAAFNDNGVRIPKRRSRRDVAPTPISRPAGTSKRNTILDSQASSTSCKKQGMYVDFEALGWKEWVIAPQGFSAFYCSGACSFPLHHNMNATSHAIVQTLVHHVRPHATSEAKCAPAQLQPMTILFVDNKKNVQIKRYRDMIVKECGCH